MRLSTSRLAILICLMSLLSPGQAQAQGAERLTVWPGPRMADRHSREPGTDRRGPRRRGGVRPEIRRRRRLHHPTRLPRQGVGRPEAAGRHQVGDQGGRGGDPPRAGPRRGPGQARRPGGEALPDDRHRDARQPSRLARRDHDPPPGHDDRRFRRRPSPEAGLPPRYRRLLFERRRQHAGGAA